MTTTLTPGPTGFAARCADKHGETLFEDRAEWTAHQKIEHKNTAGTLGYNHTRPRVSVTITAAEHEQLGRWVTGKHGPYAGKLGQVFALAPGHSRVWVSFGGSDLRDFNLGELEGAAAPAHTLSLLDPEPMPAPVAPVAAPAAPAAPVAHWATAELAVSISHGVGWVAKCSCGWVDSERYPYESEAENASIAHAAKDARAARLAPTVEAAPAPVAPEPTPVDPVAPETRQAPRPTKRRTPARPRVCGHAGPNGADVEAYWQTIEARYFAAIS